MKRLLVYVDGSVKGIPISAFSSEAWTSLFENNGGTVDVLTYYERVPWLYRGTNARALAIGSLPRCFKQNDKKLDGYVLPFRLDLSRLLNQIEADLTLHGVAYVWKDKGIPLRTKNIRRLLPASMRPIYDTDRGLVGFTRTVKGVKRDHSLEEVAYIWLPSRRRELGPDMPPAQAALRAAGVLTNIDTFVEKFFGQGTISPVIIGVDESASETDLKRVESWFQRRVTGLAHAFGAIAIRSSIKPHALMQQELDKLEMGGLSTQKREDISTALGVPHSLMFSNAANYATAYQEALNWYDMTIVPEGTMIEGPLNDQLWEPLLGIEMYFDPQRLEIYQQRETEKGAKLIGYYREQAITKNELREGGGFDPVEGGDVYKPDPKPKPSSGDSSTPVGSGGDEPPLAEDLRRWQAKALNRLKAGKSLSFKFESDVIPDSLQETIGFELGSCMTPEQVREVFKKERVNG